jgi:predicted DNA-binding protein with PD1-like motif
MQTRLLSDHVEKTWAVIFDQGDEVASGLLNFAREQQITAAHFTAIGGFREATLGYFDRDQQDYVPIPVREQVEVLSLVGDIALDENKPKVHAHVVVGKRDGATMGGHLLEAHVWPTLEVMVTQEPAHLQRVYDKSVGIPLIKL